MGKVRSRKDRWMKKKRKKWREISESLERAEKMEHEKENHKKQWKQKKLRD